MRPFIVTGCPKSGTTMLCSALDNHPQLECYGEALLTRGSGYRSITDDPGIEALRRKTYDRSLRRFVLERFGLSEADRPDVTDLCTDEIVRDYLDGLLRPGVGCKILHHHFRRTPAAVDWVRDNDVAVIHIVRNTFDRAASFTSMFSGNPDDYARDFARRDLEIEQLFSGGRYVKTAFEQLTEGSEASWLMLHPDIWTMIGAEPKALRTGTHKGTRVAH